VRDASRQRALTGTEPVTLSGFVSLQQAKMQKADGERRCRLRAEVGL